MNFLYDPCIDVIMIDGERKTLSIENTIKESDNILDLDGFTPSQYFSTIRFFVAVVQAALDGPKDVNDWINYDNIQNASINYLKKYQNYFDSNCFLQTKNVSVKKDKELSIRVLGLYWKEGNNPLIFEHNADQHVQQKDLFKFILSFQSFSPSFMKTKGTSSPIYNESRDGGIQESPCSRNLMSILSGSNLLQTIHLNLITKKDCEVLWGKPIWEYSENLSIKDMDEIRNSYLGRLVPLHRSIEIFDDTCNITQGLLYPNPKSGGYDSMASYSQNKEGEKYFARIDSSRHAWRSLYTIKDSTVIKNLYRIKDPSFVVRIYTGGIVMTKPNAGVCKPQNELSWELSFPIAVLEDNFELYKRGLDFADISEKYLYCAVQLYVQHAISNSKNAKSSISNNAKMLFWNELNKNHKILFANLNNQNIWQDFVIKSLVKSFDRSCRKESGDDFKGYVLGMKKILSIPRTIDDIKKEIESKNKLKSSDEHEEEISEVNNE